MDQQRKRLRPRKDGYSYPNGVGAYIQSAPMTFFFTWAQKNSGLLLVSYTRCAMNGAWYNRSLWRTCSPMARYVDRVSREVGHVCLPVVPA